MAFWKPGAKRPAPGASGLGVSVDVDRDGGDGAMQAYNKLAALSMREQRERLPVFKYRRELLYLVEAHTTVIVVGETGCGKSTQIPQYLCEAGWAAGGRQIAVTQPRRVAAQTLASRVAEEMGVRLGAQVGYAIRFEVVATRGVTQIKYLTDGVLLSEMQDDPLLSRYSAVMVDEAHERSAATDLLLGLLVKIQRRRPDLRVIVASATIEAHTFRKYFDRRTVRRRRAAEAAAAAAALLAAAAPNPNLSHPTDYAHPDAAPSLAPAIISVEGRTHHVEIQYLLSPTADYVTRAVEATLAVHATGGPGDILVFFPGQAEIERCAAMLAESVDRDASLPATKRPRLTSSVGGDDGAGAAPLTLLVRPLYAGLSAMAQLAAFEPPPRGVRKVVLATSIAETSVTLDGVVFVIDSLFARQSVYDPLTGLQSLLLAPVSHASAQQRAGRAGRTRPGTCLRLCTESVYAGLAPSAPPETMRCDLAGTVLRLKSLGVDNVAAWDWLAPPPAESLIRALETLYALGALGEDARLTPLVGARMAELPLEPMLAKALLVSGELGCSDELATIAAYASIQGLWVGGRDAPRALETAKLRFAAAEGDHITHLNIHAAYLQSGRSPGWCAQHLLSHRALVRTGDVREQLAAHVARIGLRRVSAGTDSAPPRRALAAGYFPHAAQLLTASALGGRRAAQAAGEATYRLLRAPAGSAAAGLSLRVHPSSIVHRCRPACVVFTAVTRTEAGAAMTEVCAIDAAWLPELAPHFYEKRELKALPG